MFIFNATRKLHNQIMQISNDIVSRSVRASLL